MKDYKRLFFIGVFILSSCGIFNASAQDIVGDLTEGISQATIDQSYDQLYDKAYEFYQNKDWDNAIRNFNAAYLKDKSKTDAIYMIGVCFYHGLGTHQIKATEMPPIFLEFVMRRG